MDLCCWASFAELHALVDELHRRRARRGPSLEDFNAQAQLKALIYLVHLYGEMQIPPQGQKEVDHDLLDILKRASRTICTLEPTGPLRMLLSTITLSWSELLSLFGLLIRRPGVEKLLGRELPQVQNYLHFNRLLYLLFVHRVLQFRRRKDLIGQYVLSDGELQELVQARPNLEDFYMQLRTTENEPWVDLIPLLPLESRYWLLSPELLYDDLLQTYLDILVKLPENFDKW